MRYAHIVGWGMEVPVRVLSNSDLEAIVETDDEWITTRTGIKERRIAEQHETTTSLALRAAQKALDIADILPSDIDLIIVATATPEYVFPSTASMVQDLLGASAAAAFDLSAACSGFIYAMDVATSKIRCGSINNALIIGAETLSRVVDWTEALAIRASLAARLEPEGASVSVNDLLLQAAARTLLEFPGLNGVFVGDPDAADAFIRPASGTAIGLVVALAEGMLVPVFHGAERRSLADIARQRSDAVVRARNFRLRHGEAGGATLTISNLGASGPDRFTAVLNPPESAILAVGRMRDLPVARDGAVVVRPVSDLTLTVDHRLADGRMASDFLARLVQILEGRDWTLE